MTTSIKKTAAEKYLMYILFQAIMFSFFKDNYHLEVKVYLAQKYFVTVSCFQEGIWFWPRWTKIDYAKCCRPLTALGLDNQYLEWVRGTINWYFWNGNVYRHTSSIAKYWVIMESTKDKNKNDFESKMYFSKDRWFARR